MKTDAGQPADTEHVTDLPSDSLEASRHGETGAPDLAQPPPARGLSTKLLSLTILFVMLAEVLIFVPSVANTRMRWLQDRLNTAGAASVVLDGMQEMRLPQPIREDTLMATGTKAIALKKDGMSRMLISADMPLEVDRQYDLAAVSPLDAVVDAFDELLFGGDRIIRVYGPIAGHPDLIIDIVMADAPLRQAMASYARNIFFLSVLISVFTAGLVFFAINRLLIRPIRHMTVNMQAFSSDPENPALIISPRGVKDELGLAERHLAAMQMQLQGTLRQQRHLADLGLAVSKINHDMRNILTSAQLISDRLANLADPMVRMLAPKLLRTIDRAVAYSGEVMAYGRAREAEPRRRFINLAALANEVRDILAEEAGSGIEFLLAIPEDLEVEADSEQLFRVLYNLCRNAVEALRADMADDAALVRRIELRASRRGGVVEITVSDTGPGMPQRAREHLFKPFRGSARAGGTGLGLAIARELVLAHGGSIALAETADHGTTFHIQLPDRPVPLDTFRARA
ncbi:ATP-binding protein [Pseudohoeflea coraliihabitans]|uniref:histidine kinase n=1 Tax=Pseudohoeflea coraliihabitans TaxID=2860393 RepID=A0ABS6WPK0_9HYPH|nr:HAMP domain-containing sensor histidine kinase [Pseudohoeflea sp. DP4N28-3]MBW3097563.1 HAMP domain-containing histidine kinase [Pseudohoeflea sp. DP4N28-3]